MALIPVPDDEQKKKVLSFSNAFSFKHGKRWWMAEIEGKE